MITDTTSFNKTLCECGKQYFKSFLPTNIVLQHTEITAGFQSVITLKLYNDEDYTVAASACFLSVKITDPWDNILPVTLNTTHPECTVVFTPRRSGLHEIAVMYLGQKLKSKITHLCVRSNDPVLKVGCQGDGNGTFNSPRDIAIDSNGYMYVADTGNGLIQKFSADGQFMKQFRVNSDKEDCTAFSIALDLNKGLIICTEVLIKDNAAVSGGTVLLFNLQGELQKTSTLSGMSCLLDIATTSLGNLLMTDTEQDCIVKADREGNFLCRLADSSRPGDVCVNEDDTIILPDTRKNCISILNPDGTVRRQFGSFGRRDGELACPYGVVTDGKYILVAEGGNDRVQVFEYDGAPVCVIESNGDPLRSPRGLAVTGDGHVYVADRDNHCIKKYRYRDMV